MTNFSASVLQNISKLAVDQQIIGIVSNTVANLRVCFGIFCTGIYKPQYSMNFTGGLNFSNGSAVANAPITFTVNYQSSQFVASSWTNSSGYFFVKIEDLPEYVMKKDLNMTIYVQSEVEAVYNCYYNYSLGKCCKQPRTTC